MNLPFLLISGNLGENLFNTLPVLNLTAQTFLLQSQTSESSKSPPSGSNPPSSTPTNSVALGLTIPFHGLKAQTIDCAGASIRLDRKVEVGRNERREGGTW